MSHVDVRESDIRPFPKAALVFAAAIVLAAVVAAAIASFTGFGTLRMPPQPSVEYRELSFVDREDGTLEVRDAKDGRVLDVIAADADGFLRGVVRSLMRERRFRETGNGEPLRLSRKSDGRVVMEDRATGSEIVLNAFGRTNLEAAARFLPNREGRR